MSTPNWSRKNYIFFYFFMKITKDTPNLTLGTLTCKVLPKDNWPLFDSQHAKLCYRSSMHIHIYTFSINIYKSNHLGAQSDFETINYKSGLLGSKRSFDLKSISKQLDWSNWRFSFGWQHIPQHNESSYIPQHNQSSFASLAPDASSF